MRWRIPIVISLALFVAVSCDQQPVAPMTDTEAVTTPLFNNGSGVVELVSAGSNDACAAFGLPNGCDGNFSLTAHVKADGTVGGQYQDTFAGGGEGIHAEIQCLKIVGNGAVVGGLITKGTMGGTDITGQSVFTAVIDNGTSANDTPDEIGFSVVGGGTPPSFCTNLDPFNFPAGTNPLTTGQVKVK